MTRAVVTHFWSFEANKWRKSSFWQPPRRPLKLFPKPYSWILGRTVSMSRSGERCITTTTISVVFPAFAEKSCPRSEKNRPGHAWLMPRCSTDWRCAIGRDKCGGDARRHRGGDELRQRPFHDLWGALSSATLHLANSINTPVIDHWRGRVAVLLESGVPRSPQMRRSARNSSVMG